MLARARHSVRRHLVRASLTAVGTLLWSLAASQSAMGQAPPALLGRAGSALCSIGHDNSRPETIR
jgi:hypothetical protein